MAASLSIALVDALGGAGQVQVDPSSNAARVSIRPLEHNQGGALLGHYRGVGVSGAVASISAAGIISSFTWLPRQTAYAVIEKISLSWECLSAITAATVVDFSGFIFRGATANSSGTSSAVVTPSRMRATMAASQLVTGGEFRMIGTTTALTAATGSTADTSRFAALQLGTLTATNSTGTVVTQSAGLAASGVLYNADSFRAHPLVLAAGEGFQVSIITANNTTGTVQITQEVIWSEVASF